MFAQVTAKNVGGVFETQCRTRGKCRTDLAFFKTLYEP